MVVDGRWRVSESEINHGDGRGEMHDRKYSTVSFDGDGFGVL
jgi:hypothetical protein